MSRLTQVKCTIERGGFSSERTFEVSMPDGSVIVGTANIQYLQDQDGNPLGEDEPERGVKMNGFVKCRVIRQIQDQMLIEFPSTDVIRIPAEEFAEMAC